MLWKTGFYCPIFPSIGNKRMYVGLVHMSHFGKTVVEEKGIKYHYI